jgi:hypothetical protein
MLGLIICQKMLYGEPGKRFAKSISQIVPLLQVDLITGHAAMLTVACRLTNETRISLTLLL